MVERVLLTSDEDSTFIYKVLVLGHVLHVLRFQCCLICSKLQTELSCKQSFWSELDACSQSGCCAPTHWRHISDIQNWSGVSLCDDWHSSWQARMDSFTSELMN